MITRRPPWRTCSGRSTSTLFRWVRLFWKGPTSPPSAASDRRVSATGYQGFRSALDCGAAARSSTHRLAWLSGDDKSATATISASTLTASTTNCVDHPATAQPWHRGAADVLHLRRGHQPTDLLDVLVEDGRVARVVTAGHGGALQGCPPEPSRQVR